ncbi:MAG TPA: substrate-binding domain-containing protein [Thermoplasmata archaeon]|nr:substrate-binding domain-containing protein [Thermoplasmata archaeon]
MAAATPVWIVVVIVVAAGVGGLGFYAGYEYRGSPAASPSATANSTLAIGAAGTLTVTFPELANELVNQTPGITAPVAAQNYEGSLDVTSAIAALSLKVDVAALADFRLIPQLLEPQFAAYEIAFAQTQEVLMYNASLPGFAGITPANWGFDLVNVTSAGGTARLGIWNASTDPNGYNEIFSLMLQGMLYEGNDLSAVYGHFYSGAPGAYATPNPSTTVNEHESAAASLVETGVVSAVITYKAVAIQNHLPYVLLDPIVGLGANNSTALADYAKLSTQIIGSSGALAPVYPAPIVFAATVPTNAPNAALGALFLHLLLSPQGSAILAQGGAWTPIFPGWADHPTAVPGLLQPDVTTFPAWATSFLPS